MEAYLPPNGHELQVMLKGETFKTHRYSEIEMKGVEIVEVSDSEFVFTSIDTGLSVKVLITDSSILNIAVIPHLMMVDRVMGLLGNFDGDSENDLLLMSESLGFSLKIRIINISLTQAGSCVRLKKITRTSEYPENKKVGHNWRSQALFGFFYIHSVARYQKN